MTSYTKKKSADWVRSPNFPQPAVRSGRNVSNVVPSNHHTTSHDDVNQDSDWDRKRSNTVELLRNLQVGNPPSGITPQDCVYPDSVANVLQAYETHGIAAALKLLEATPDLYRLVCEAETPPTVDEAALQVRSVPKIGAEVDLRNHSVGRLLLVAAACFLLLATILKLAELSNAIAQRRELIGHDQRR